MNTNDATEPSTAAGTAPGTQRPTAMIRDADDRPLDRDEYAQALAQQAQPTPETSDRASSARAKHSRSRFCWTSSPRSTPART